MNGLHYAANAGQLSVLNWIIDQVKLSDPSLNSNGRGDSLRECVNRIDKGGKTALHGAAAGM